MKPPPEGLQSPLLGGHSHLRARAEETVTSRGAVWRIFGEYSVLQDLENLAKPDNVIIKHVAGGAFDLNKLEEPVLYIQYGASHGFSAMCGCAPSHSKHSAGVDKWVPMQLVGS